MVQQAGTFDMESGQASFTFAAMIEANENQRTMISSFMIVLEGI